MRPFSLLLLSVFALSTCKCTHKAPDLPLPEREPLSTTFAEMPGAVEAKVRILDDNVEAWVERVRILEAATKSIEVSYFIVEADAYGLAMLALLSERARAGVNVRMMVDGRGSFSFVNGADGRYLGALKNAGVDVRLYNPMIQQVGEVLAKGDLRAGASSNHDKIIIVDGAVAILGGRNISKDYLSDPRDMKTAYTDMDVRVEGPAVASLVTQAFEVEWPRAKPLNINQKGDEQVTLALALTAMRRWIKDKPYSPAELAKLDALNEDDKQLHDIAVALEGDVVGALPEIPADGARDRLKKVTKMLALHKRLKGALDRPPPSTATVRTRVLDSVGMEGEHAEHAINDALLSSIVSAKKSVVLQSPYLVLSEREVRGLEGASARGVEIIFLTNSPLSSDSAPTQGAFLQQWPWVLARVPKARVFVISEERLMHAKVFIVDKQIGFVGSYNIDPLSRGVNSEIVAAMWGPDVAGRLEGLVRAMIGRGPPKTFEYLIRRGKDGYPVFQDGAPVVDFGPEDHLDKEALQSAKAAQPFADLLHPFL